MLASESFQQHKGSHFQRCCLGLPWLLTGIWGLYWQFQDQLGAVITQNNRPLEFFSRKLSTAQQKYSLTKQELLAIVEALKEFKGMLWGQTITVYTDHKNLLHDARGLTSDWVYHWRLLLEEYGPTIMYIKGIHNTVDRETWMNFTQCWCYHHW